MCGVYKIALQHCDTAAVAAVSHPCCGSLSQYVKSGLAVFMQDNTAQLNRVAGRGAVTSRLISGGNRLNKGGGNR